MIVATQPLAIISNSGETELTWVYTTDENEFRQRPRREGEVVVLDRSALLEAQQTRRAVFTAAQIEGQKIYTR